ncbi:hypothetical protein E2C01_054179 [Portunus trituberculatus]|uniref:Uncharacterized protein n=1 Tax=Portunus trituberculatus TaxID=210409 RepID=A0A5B7GJ72_PORTR|nr:hypothetical protein [Portunus trituberculatus]
MDENSVLETPGHTSSLSTNKPPRCEKVLPVGEAKRKRDTQKDDGAKQQLPSVVGPSHAVNTPLPSADHSATNSAITSAMTVSGKLIDMRLFHTNGLLSKAFVPVAQCISDIEEGKGKLVSSYLEGLNTRLILLASAVNYVNKLQKKVALIHINNSALAELYKWECAVGREELFPFDVTKKCDEICKTRKLGRPSFCSLRMS